MSLLQTEFDTPPCEYGMPCEPCLEIAHIEAQIKNLHSRLKDLHQQHRQASLRRNHVHSPLIHRFPLEIVTDIFTNAFPPRDHLCNRKKMDPLILGKVCHTWRELSFSIPRLWCDIVVDVGKPYLPLLNHQVAHSGMLPLSILLFTFSRSLALPRAEEAIYFVVKQLHRTGSLCLNLPKNVISLFDSISELDYPKATPRLDELHIHSHNFRLGVIEPPRPQQMVSRSTSLNHIVLDWTSITKLKLQGCCPDGLLLTLVASTHLKELNLWLDLDDSDIPTMPAFVVIPSIEFLILGNVEAAQFMFTMTILPSLRTLQASGYGLFLSEPLLSDFLCRSLCPLQVLSVNQYIDNYEDDEKTIIVQTLIDVLGNTNMLRELSLASFDKIFDFEPLVRQLSQNRGFLPCLQTLSMSTRFIPQMELLLDVMEARSDAIQPLQELQLVYREPCNIPQDDVQRIIRLRVAGKMISITSWIEGTKTDVVEYWKGFYGFAEQKG